MAAAHEGSSSSATRSTATSCTTPATPVLSPAEVAPADGPSSPLRGSARAWRWAAGGSASPGCPTARSAGPAPPGPARAPPAKSGQRPPRPVQHAAAHGLLASHPGDQPARSRRSRTLHATVARRRRRRVHRRRPPRPAAAGRVLPRTPTSARGGTTCKRRHGVTTSARPGPDCCSHRYGAATLPGSCVRRPAQPALARPAGHIPNLRQQR